MTIVYLSLGTNMGDREEYLSQAVQYLAKIPNIHLLAQSSIYETAAWGKTDQADFLNMACQLDTQLTAADFLKETQAIEQSLGRVRHEKWGPRTIDIDILLFGEEVYDTKELKVPHPYMTERAFVLIPLLELQPDFKLPPNHKFLRDYLAALDTSDITLFSARQTES
ncbi:2-amino-4-hydroxy-6-hydroxymethyldihydropteridine diphosphokinase [Streptococcus dysgalactiae subsp. equisimilis]|uniref:2-amino-4-hydroxy-6- hydroxymethyldihydropteridine diphosphokinase n=1 Tax=Streptococcus dysgalactiae TaxID=1334 RepID=UPI000A12152A|nr:2-amino-4-hydroxy-6-hydroxymethyldihydropteridine diphosphokinase [Streptococcus dysgalactiae]MCY7195127.1 2-amino-4-hydroxy-6-hydroxymethyldihydropteridine diphosphokinase [Streptococcus dysgalactiae]MCY7199677.1 2-amino-4-hydroxy-6-hydroxymethyldihydropteridine diphosphokinase [Streptococcus dysgalactiae]MCY7206683.1 2-amino-4-hydroxy-6-hydroxymethyldihydropteridine diphosphokinase [Streptococcus dysgalactiae]ORJ90300.1 2-amino-4-hydroxy-6-hydroxymethyldihydropteridine diphosphokinase [Str